MVAALCWGRGPEIWYGRGVDGLKRKCSGSVVNAAQNLISLISI